MEPLKRKFISLFPNPAHNSLQVVFDRVTRGDWKVDIFGMNGMLADRLIFWNVLTARINLRPNEMKGVYLLRAVNINTKEHISERFIVQ